MIRKIGGFVAGAVVLGLVVYLLQQVSTLLHPMPEGLNPMDEAQADAFAAYLSGMPVTAWVVTFLSELVGALAGALIGGWVARDAYRGVTAALVGLAFVGSALNWMAFSHPSWFVVGQVIGYPGVLMGVWVILSGRDLGGSKDGGADGGAASGPATEAAS